MKRSGVSWARGFGLVGTLILAGCGSTDFNVLGSGTGVTASDPTR
jgi:hypothetical protein